MNFKVLVLFVVSACAAFPKRGTSIERTLEPAPTGPLANLEHRLAAPKGSSGFALIDTNEDALRWRLALIDSAERSLDLMTFLWWGDEAGDLLLKRIVDAANRGVKVRLIVDDMTTIDDGKRLKLRDVSNAAIDAHPNIELRVFNPFVNRNAVGRAVEFVGDFTRKNQRMHNKALIADNRAAVVGGRNLGNEYMGLNETFNFRDIDVLAVGPSSRQVAAVFDHYWNSEWVVANGQLAPMASQQALAQEYAGLVTKLTGAKPLQRFPLERQSWASLLDGVHLELGTSDAVTDETEAGRVDHQMPDVIRALWAGASSEVLVSNAYILPDDAAFERTAKDVKPTVRFVMLTNSLASTDAAGVHAHYTDWRPKMVKGGVELYELRPDARVRADVADTAPISSQFLGLHAKVIVVDRRHVLIGSMNLDPRSWVHNTEMGLVIDCPPLARELAQAIERDLRPENAWRIELKDGALLWRAGEQTLTEAPARASSQRLEEVLNLLLPADLF